MHETGPFSIPAIRSFVPEKVKPWIIVIFVIIFQLSGGVYLAAVSEMVGGDGFNAGRHHDGRLRFHGRNGFNLHRYVPVKIPLCFETDVTRLLYRYHLQQPDLRTHPQRSSACCRLLYCRDFQNVGNLRMQFHPPAMDHAEKGFIRIFQLHIPAGAKLHPIVRINHRIYGILV